MHSHSTRMLTRLTIGLTLIFGAGVAVADAVVEVQTSKLTKMHAQQVSDSGMGIVQQISKARKAIGNKKLRAAKQHVWKAMELANRLKAQSPTEDLRQRIAAASKSLEKNGKLDRKKDLVPIYEQLDVAKYENEDDIRVYLADAEKGSAEKGSKSDAVVTVDDHLASAAADVEYMEVDIALDKVVQDLRRAHHALAQPAMRADAAAADALLDDAQKNVHVVMGQASTALDEDDLSDS